MVRRLLGRGARSSAVARPWAEGGKLVQVAVEAFWLWIDQTAAKGRPPSGWVGGARPGNVPSLAFYSTGCPATAGDWSAGPALCELGGFFLDIDIHHLPSSSRRNKSSSLLLNHATTPPHLPPSHVPPPPRPRHVPQAVRHRHRPPLRQVRRQVPRLRLVRAPHDARAHLRRVQLRQLPEQVRRLRRRGHLRRLLLLRVHAPREGPRRLPQDYQPGQLEDRPVLPEEDESVDELLAPGWPGYGPPFGFASWRKETWACCTM